MHDPNIDERANFVRQRVAQMTKSYLSRRRKNRALAFIVRLSIIGYGTLTTVLLGLRGYHPFNLGEELLASAALISSAAVTVFSAWEIFFDHRWLWILYTRTVTELTEVADDLTYEASDLSKERLDELYARFHTILNETNMAWTEKRRRERMPGDPGVLHEPPRPSPHAT